MRILKDPQELRNCDNAVAEAVSYALTAPGYRCTKTCRGAALYRGRQILSCGRIFSADEELCDPCIREHIHDNSRPELCPGIHAEQDALFNALVAGIDIHNARMVHAKIKNGRAVPSGSLSCTWCSRTVLYLLQSHGINIEFILIRPEGYCLYTPEEFNRESFGYFLQK